MPKHHYKKKQSLIGRFLEYGFHLWILLFVSNLLIFYSFSLFSFGAESANTIVPSISPSEIPPTSPTAQPPVRAKRVPTPKPNGPAVSLSFSVPGIGSAGGTFIPTRTKRNLTVYLYAIDVNSNDNKVKPLYTIHTTAEFDTNELSGTYTSFVNRNIDLGDTVKNGKYQIAFSTDQALRKLVKDKDDAIGGKIVSLTRANATILPPQRVLMGDISPTRGNNIMDINDYNVLVDCFGQTPASCNYYYQADLNDDGQVDGIDYNIMARSFMTLVSEGIAPPQLPTPKPTQVKKLSELEVTPKVTKPPVKPSPSPQPVQKASSGNPIGALFGFLFFLILLGGGGVFVVTKTAFGQNLLKTIMKKKDAQKEPSAETPSPDATATETPAAPTTEAIAESTEIPIAQAEAEKKATPPAETPQTAPAPADPNTIDKTFYVKNKSKDEKGTWVTLTDDAGPIDGLLPNGTVEDGFERIKGTLVDEKGKKYVLIKEVLPAE